MKTKKILTLGLVAAMGMTAIGGTLAYFTDTDTATNVIGTGITETDGKVKIELVEQERGDEGLQEFTQEKSLLPIVGSAQGEKDEFGMPTAANYVDKIVNVTNLAEDAYVRVYIGIPTELDNVGDAGKNILHVNVGNKFDPTGQKTEANANVEHTDYYEYWGKEVLVATEIDIDNVDYNIYSYTYQQVLTTEETTGYAAIVGCYLDAGVDYDNDEGHYTINGESIETNLSQVKIPVYAIGVQAAGFDDANTALEAAFGEDYNPWAE